MTEDYIDVYGGYAIKLLRLQTRYQTPSSIFFNYVAAERAIAVAH